jgi:hypothetical protein
MAAALVMARTAAVVMAAALVMAPTLVMAPAALVTGQNNDVLVMAPSAAVVMAAAALVMTPAGMVAAMMAGHRDGYHRMAAGVTAITNLLDLRSDRDTGNAEAARIDGMSGGPAQSQPLLQIIQSRAELSSLIHVL